MMLKLLYLMVSISMLALAHEGAAAVKVRPDWTAIGNAFALVLISGLTTWTAWKHKKTAKTVDTVHDLVNSRMGSELFTAMVSAKALVAADDSPNNIELLKIAEQKYLAHQVQQATVDAAKKKT